MSLRPYQQSAFDAAVEWIKESIDSFLIEAATGAGKSHIVAALADWVEQNTGKAVLCLAPTKELVVQNRKKFLATTGRTASLYSSSAGGKCLRHNVIFATPGTAKNAIGALSKRVACVIVDEAHRTTDTVKAIIAGIKENSPYLRVGGLTATPYRTNEGYIYAVNEDGKTEKEVTDPFYHRMIFRITAEELLEQGYLTPPVMHAEDGYDTSGLQIKRGKFTNASVDRAFVGQGRKTSRIVAQVVDAARNRSGVMFFAANRKHAREIMDSLPPEISAMVDGTTKNRDEIIEEFQAQKIKYLVNVDVLTTGFDATHVDLIAILRKTESASLLQQIIGRGLRLHSGKDDCLVMDFAENIKEHCPDGNLFAPVIKVKRKGESKPIDVTCPDCGYVNEFSVRKDNPDHMEITEHGYLCDLDGELLMTDDGEPYPAHYGRRCMGFVRVGKEHERCGFRWAHKVCPDCGLENDIAARACKCGAELVNPNEKLREEFYKLKKDPSQWQCDLVKDWSPSAYRNAKDNEVLAVQWETEYRTFKAYYTVGSMGFNNLCQAVFGRIAPSAEKFVSALVKGYGEMPKSVRYCKRNDFYYANYFNGEIDEIPT